jgi:lysophospholipase L1-like esterase
VPDRAGWRRQRVVVPLALALALVVAVLLLLAAGVHGRSSATVTSGPLPAFQGQAAHYPLPGPARPERIVVLGDSVPAGVACSCPSFGELLARTATLATRRPAVLDNYALGGLTTAGLAAQLSADGTPLVAALRRATTVTVTIGANDFDSAQAEKPACETSGTACFGADLAALPGSLRASLDRIRALAGPNARILVTGYWNVFLDGDVAAARGGVYVRSSDTLTRAVDARIAQTARAAGGRYIDLYGPFKGGGNPTPLLAPDGDHPSAAGHRLISRLLAHASGLT